MPDCLIPRQGLAYRVGWRPLFGLRELLTRRSEIYEIPGDREGIFRQPNQRRQESMSVTILHAHYRRSYNHVEARTWLPRS
jgi:hypothetical protein